MARERYFCCGQHFVELHSDRRLASQAKPRDICLWNVSKGFKSGGFDGRPINGISAPTAFNPKKGTTYEVGSKLDLLDRHLRFNTALFYRDYDDVHVQVVQTIKGITVNEKNADKARIKGIEVEATLIPPTQQLNTLLIWTRSAVQALGSTYNCAPTIYNELPNSYEYNAVDTAIVASGGHPLPYPTTPGWPPWRPVQHREPGPCLELRAVRDQSDGRAGQNVRLQQHRFWHLDGLLWPTA